MLMDGNNGTMLLLSWVNSERQLQGQTTTLYDLRHLIHTPFLYRLLQRVSHNYFHGLNHLNLQLQHYLTAIEEYLMEAEGKKIARTYKKQILQNEAIQEIIKIVLHLLIQGQNKGQFISRIVQLSVEVQTYLMEEIKKVQGHVENFVQIKDILSTVEKLEDENEVLRNKLKTCNEINEQLSQNIAQSKGERLKMETEMQTYRNEKRQVYEELQISDLKDYIELYRMIKLENVELNYSIQEMEQNKKEVETENEAMKDRIQEDYQTINQLQEEITHLRQNYNAAKQEISCLSISYQHPDDAEDCVLRENKNIGNVAKLRMSFQDTTCPSEKNSLFLSHTFQEEENSQNERLRAYNSEIIFKLDIAYSTITKLTNEANSLRDEKGELQKKNSYLAKKLAELRKEHNRFVKELRSMGI